MENMDKKQGEGMCMHGNHGSCCGHMGMEMHRCHGNHHLLRMILKIVIVIIIFSAGFKLGFIAGYIQNGYGPEKSLGGWGMMRGYNYNNILPPTNTIPTSVK